MRPCTWSKGGGLLRRNYWLRYLSKPAPKFTTKVGPSEVSTAIPSDFSRCCSCKELSGLKTTCAQVHASECGMCVHACLCACVCMCACLCE